MSGSIASRRVNRVAPSQRAGSAGRKSNCRIHALEPRMLLTAGWIQGSYTTPDIPSINTNHFSNANHWVSSHVNVSSPPAGARITSVKVTWDFDADEAGDLTARLWNATLGSEYGNGVLVATWSDIKKTGDDPDDGYGESSHETRTINNPIWYSFSGPWTLELQDSSSDVPLLWLDDGRMDSWSITVNYEYQGADLSPYKCVVPSQLSWGEAFSVDAGIKNLGKIATYKMASYRLYLSSNALLDRSDVLLSSRNYQLNIPAGGSIDINDWGITMPAAVPAGFKASGPVYILLQVDAANAIPENYETNNLISKAVTIPGVDLVGVQCNAPAAIAWGNSFTLQYAVANIGAGTDPVAPRNGLKQAFYLSTDKVFNSSDRLLGTATYSKVIPGGTSDPKLGATAKTTLALPQMPPAGYAKTGTLYIFMMTDTGNSVKESFENNNFGYKAFANKVGTDWDSFLVQLPPTGTLSGTIFNDADGDKTLDSGESGLAGRTAYLDANNNSTLDTGERTAVTNTSGLYTFSGLPAGSYKVRQAVVSGWRQTTPDNNNGYTLTLSAGQTSGGNNFGATQTVLYSGTVFNDANGNKAMDSSESGLGSWTVFIDTDKDGVLDSNERRTTTWSSGKWWLGGMTAGTYRVAIVQQSGWSRTTPLTSYFELTLSAGQAKYDMLSGEKKIT